VALALLKPGRREVGSGFQPAADFPVGVCAEPERQAPHPGFAANGNGASDPYQGTTSVVPTIMAGIKGFSP
jgi:hypothetical protein